MGTNIPDFTRYTTKTRPVYFQGLFLPLIGSVLGVLGIVGTSCAKVLTDPTSGFLLKLQLNGIVQVVELQISSADSLGLSHKSVPIYPPMSSPAQTT
jgi:hypothetical protein